jgi:dTDP-4-amino-4,6-dideoxygalactose transaminase
VEEKIALEGGKPLRTEPFPAWPIYDEREEAALLEVVRSGQWGALTGSKVKEFERRFAAYQQARFGTCVVNGTAALEIALRAVGVGPGDEVITTPYTFIATANAILHLGAVPVFVDIDPTSYLIDVTKIEEAITARTKALLPVHIAGCPPNMDVITAISSRHALAVVEDACQAWGAEWKGGKVGASGDAGTFSFQSSKNITAGEGGIIVTNREDVADRCWSLHNVGRVKGGAWYEHPNQGWNYRMTEWQGAVLLVQLERLAEQSERRDINARYLARQLEEIRGIETQSIDPRVTRHAWHLVIIRYDPGEFGGMSRDRFVTALEAEGIPCTRGYLPLNQSQSLREAKARNLAINGGEREATAVESSCPIAERVCSEEAVWLPQSIFLGTKADMESIVESIAKIQLYACRHPSAHQPMER